MEWLQIPPQQADLEVGKASGVPPTGEGRKKKKPDNCVHPFLVMWRQCYKSAFFLISLSELLIIMGNDGFSRAHKKCSVCPIEERISFLFLGEHLHGKNWRALQLYSHAMPDGNPKSMRLRVTDPIPFPWGLETYSPPSSRSLMEE